MFKKTMALLFVAQFATSAWSGGTKPPDEDEEEQVVDFAAATGVYEARNATGCERRLEISFREMGGEKIFTVAPVHVFTSINGAPVNGGTTVTKGNREVLFEGRPAQGPDRRMYRPYVRVIVPAKSGGESNVLRMGQGKVKWGDEGPVPCIYDRTSRL